MKSQSAGALIPSHKLKTLNAHAAEIDATR